MPKFINRVPTTARALYIALRGKGSRRISIRTTRGTGAIVIGGSFSRFAGSGVKPILSQIGLRRPDGDPFFNNYGVKPIQGQNYVVIPGFKGKIMPEDPRRTCFVM